MPNSFLKLAARLPPFKILPVKLAASFALVRLMMLKRRSLSPAVLKFAECVRDVMKHVSRG